MEHKKYNVRAVHTPFDALGLQVMAPNVDSHAPFFVSRDPKPEAHTSEWSKHEFVGARGLMKLRADVKKAKSDVISPKKESSAASTPDIDEANSPGFYRRTTMQLVSRHSKGRVMLHDASTGSVESVLTHDGGSEAAVAQLAVTEKYIFTRLEDAPARNDDNPLQADYNIYAWDTSNASGETKSGHPPHRCGHVLHHHTARVVAIAAHAQNPSLLASAGLDALLCVWDLEVSTAQPVFERPMGDRGIVSSLTWWGNLLIVNASEVPLSIWQYSTSTLSLIAQTPPDHEAAVSSVCVVAADELKQGNHSSRPMLNGDLLPNVYVGNTSGFVCCWSPVVSSTVTDGVETAPKVSYKLTVKTKEHKTAVSLLAVHNNAVIISGSLSAGLAFFNIHTGRQFFAQANLTQSTFDNSGTSALLMDTTNCAALAGMTSGCIARYDYSAFAASQNSSPAVDVTCAWALRPHTAAVTGFVVEVTSGNVWERVTTSCSDGSFTTIHILPEHGSKAVFTFPPAKGPVPLSSNNFLNSALMTFFPGDDPQKLNGISVDTIIGLSGIDRAFARAGSPDVDLIGFPEAQNRAPEILYRITHEGAVLSAAERQIELTGTPSRFPRLPKFVEYSALNAPDADFPFCVALSFSSNARVLCALYSNGLLQMVELSSFFVCARHWLSGAVVSIVARSHCVEVVHKDQSKTHIPYHRAIPAFN